MGKSIENIWKEGFETNNSFELPLIKNLYARKSKLIIDKIKSTSKWDNLSLIPIAILLYGFFAFLSKMVLGIYLAALIILLFFMNKRIMKKLDQFDVGSNTYQYLTTYYIQLKIIQKFYTKLMAIGLPIFIIPAYWMYFLETPMMINFMGLAIYFQIIIVAVIASLLSGLGVLCYKLSTHLVYGKLITRIEETINDMKEFAKI